MENNLGKLPVISVDRFIDIGTHKLHVVLTDVPGEYTIVLEAGGGKDASSYQEIQARLAAQTGVRVMSYDRSGFGQSELGPEHYNAVDEARGLKRCLDIQGFTGGLILAGLSYGGYMVQLFASLYPEQVSGLVLIDPMNIRFVDRFGLENLNAVTPYFDDPKENFEKAGNRMVDHGAESFAAMRGKELPPQVPVILITSGIPPIEEELWRRCHEEMVMGSENHQLLIAEGNHHDIVEENPDLVVQMILEMIGRIS